MEKIIEIIKKYWMLSILAAILLLSMLFGKQARRLFSPPRRRRRRPVIKKTIRRRRSSRTNRRPLPRSVGMSRASGKGYPKVGGGYIPFKRNKDGTIKKAAFVKGTVAAKRRMSQLRKKR